MHTRIHTYMYKFACACLSGCVCIYMHAYIFVSASKFMECLLKYNPISSVCTIM